MEKIEQINRITEMETRLNNTTDAVHSLSDAVEKYLSAIENIKVLEKYYTSPLWLKDFTADENGEFPADLKRGVLSEDGICNLLFENKELIELIKKSF